MKWFQITVSSKKSSFHDFQITKIDVKNSFHDFQITKIGVKSSFHDFQITKIDVKSSFHDFQLSKMKCYKNSGSQYLIFMNRTYFLVIFTDKMINHKLFSNFFVDFINVKLALNPLLPLI